MSLWCQQDRMGLAEFRNWSQLKWSRKRSPHTWLFTERPALSPAHSCPPGPRGPPSASRSPRLCSCCDFHRNKAGGGAWGRLGVQERPGGPPVPWSVPLNQGTDTALPLLILSKQTVGLGSMRRGMSLGDSAANTVLFTRVLSLSVMSDSLQRHGL